jgi:polyhydroxyalkanoate synthesis regulator phasin
MAAISEDAQVRVEITWPKIVAAVLPVLGAIGLGYWALVERTIDGINQSIVVLREEAGKRLDEGENEDRDIRRVIEDARTLLRVEMQASRTEFGARVDKLGDRIVAANEAVGRQIELLRTELTAAMDTRDQAVQGRFDRLERKVDDLLNRTPVERAVPVPQ